MAGSAAERDIPKSDRDEVVRSMLRTARSKGSGGVTTSLQDKLGERYDVYEKLVVEYVGFIDTPYSKRPDPAQFMNDFDKRAKEAGFSPYLQQGIKDRARYIYGCYIDGKYVIQAEKDAGKLGIMGGTDPNVFLGDESHRR